MKARTLTIAALAALSVALAGCVKEAESSAAAGRDYRIDRLFTRDGCTVYRFIDRDYRYFTRCDGAASSGTSWSENCGKNCTRQQ